MCTYTYSYSNHYHAITPILLEFNDIDNRPTHLPSFACYLGGPAHVQLSKVFWETKSKFKFIFSDLCCSNLLLISQNTLLNCTRARTLLNSKPLPCHGCLLDKRNSTLLLDTSKYSVAKIAWLQIKPSNLAQLLFKENGS